jgi:hypothetical protein
MPYLWSMRQGWQSENLAKFILSKFSFIAQPSTVSDDIGSDFYCTLFQTYREGSHKYLVPRSSFAIQIKSDVAKIPFSNKVDYLLHLQIPFFVGVADKKELKLTIYSGEYVPLLFPYTGPKIRQLEIELRERVEFSNFYDKLERGSYIVRFPRLMEIDASIEEEEQDEKVQILLDRCFMIQGNIASWRNSEHTYKVYGYEYPVWGVAGSGSARVFRENFLKRLAEVFHNLYWIKRSRPKQYSVEEFEMYREFYDRLKEHYPSLPPYIPEFIEPKLKALLDETT